MRDVLNSQSLGITNIGQVGDELEVINHLGAVFAASLNAKAQDATKTLLEVSLGNLVRRVARQARVGDPADLGALLEVLGEGEGVLGVALGAQRQRLGAEQELLRGKGVEVGAQVADNLDARADDEGDGAKRLPELEAVVALGRLDKLREARGVGAPVKLAAVDNDTADRGAVAANPLGCGVHDNVGAVVNRAQEVTTSAKGVVDLSDDINTLPRTYSINATCGNLQQGVRPWHAQPWQ